MSTPTSSSAAATKIRSPAGSKPSRASEAIATALAATSPFMSRAPRPQTSPSRTSADHGSTSHSPGSACTVSVCERRARRGPSPRPGILATRLARSGHLRVELASDPALREVVPEQLGRARLVPRRIHRVEADQLPEELGRLVAERDGRHVSREHTSVLWETCSRMRPTSGCRRRLRWPCACGPSDSRTSSARSRCSASTRPCGWRSQKTGSAPRSSTGRRAAARRRWRE